MRLRKVSVFALLSLATALLVGCSADNDGETNSRREKHQSQTIELKLAFDEGQKNSTKMEKVGEGLKFGFSEGDKIGVFATKRAKGSPNVPLTKSGNFIHNAQFVLESGEWVLKGGQAAQYPSDSEVLDVYVYYPYNDNGGAPQGLNPLELKLATATDQTSTTDIRGMMLYATAADIAPGVKISATMQHLASIVAVNIDVVDASTTVYLKNVADGVAVNMNNGSATPSDKVTVVTMRRGGEGMNFYAIVPAQTVAAGKEFITIDGISNFQNSTLTEDAVLVAGKYKTFDVAQAASPEVVIPDAAFRKVILEQLSLPSDHKLTFSDVMKVRSVNVGALLIGGSSSLSGIEHLKNLETLTCTGNNNLTKLDLTGLTKLREINASNCSNLTEVILTGCVSLEKMSFMGAGIKNIDFSGLDNMKSISCGKFLVLTSPIETVNVSGCYSLEEFKCQGSNLKNVDFTGLVNLRHVEVHDNSKLTEVKLEGCSSLEELYCYNTALLPSVDVAECSNSVAIRWYSGGSKPFKVYKKDASQVVRLQNSSGTAYQNANVQLINKN